MPAMCLGQRLNNPLNIRYSARNHWLGLHPSQPQERGFCHFISAAHGYRAAVVLMKTYIRRYGLLTPAQIITRWAPPSENRTELYIASVCGRSRLERDTPLRPEGPDLGRLTAAIARQETGMHIVPEKVDEIRKTFGV